MPAEVMARRTRVFARFRIPRATSNDCHARHRTHDDGAGDVHRLGPDDARFGAVFAASGGGAAVVGGGWPGLRNHPRAPPRRPTPRPLPAGVLRGTPVHRRAPTPLGG